MASDCPCGKCENKGCGSYHDECPKYISWKDRRAFLKKPFISKARTSKQATYDRDKKRQFYK